MNDKDMLTFISLIALVFVMNLRSVVVSVLPSAQATWVTDRSNPFKKKKKSYAAIGYQHHRKSATSFF